MKSSPPSNKNLRADTAWVLYQILEKGKSSRDCFDQIQRRHNTQDNAWIQEMTRGILRQLPLLQTWLRTLLERPLKGEKKVIEHLMLLGIYQLSFSRVTDHAAVSETVNAASYLGGMKLKGLLNAVLRNFQRQELALKPIEDPLIQSGLPKWMYKRIVAVYPDDAENIIANMNQIAPIWLRVNITKLSRSQYCKALEEQEIAYEIPEHQPEAIILKKRVGVTALPGYQQGWFAVQDGAAQLAAAYLNPQPGERILDCCAAPGGKTSHILERQPGITHCTALDNAKSRLTRVTENMARLGHHANVLCGDAAQPADWWDGEYYDRILLDAPCSALGVVRRHPDIRWHRKASDIEQLVQLQSSILDAMWPLLRPGGTLLYATCSLLPEENIQQIAAFLQRTPEAELSPLTDKETSTLPGRQILPGEEQMDGFYYARLIKSTQ